MYTEQELKNLINDGDIEFTHSYREYGDMVNGEYVRHAEPKDITRQDVVEGYSEFEEILSKDTPVILPDDSEAYMEESYGGAGCGEKYYYVFKLNSPNPGHPLGPVVERYFKVDGYYASYDGGYYDELYEVFPKQVLRTEWDSAS